ncbi:hypothetical protein AYO22_00845 [Fonsecaea multimorphosa]|nr:hypothetical protein AYO22_00845 [Fonsecaea multimorphosa]
MTNWGYLIFSRAVRNDAMKHDPPEIYGWRVILLALSASFGAMLFGMERFGLDKAKSAVALANLQANIVSTLQAGAFLGAILAAPLADNLGRRTSLLIAGCVAMIGIIIQFNSWGHVAVLYVGRFVAGVGVGACSMVTPLYISENVPRAVRGLLTGIYQLFVVLGGMLAFWINYGADLHLPGDSAWVVPVAIQGLPAALLLLSMYLCNESPRYLARQDRWEDAKATLAKVRMLPIDHTYIEAEFHDIKLQLEREAALMGGAGFKDLMREMWKIQGNRKRTLITITIMICQQMTGVNAIAIYAPQIFQNIGIRGHSTELFATGIYGIVKFVACAVFLLFVADTLGRRKSLLWTSIGQGCCMLFIGLYLKIQPPLAGEPVPPVGYVALVCIFLYAIFFQFGWGPVCWIYISEIPSARLRALSVSIAATTQWLFNFVVSRAVPNMLATAGSHGFGTYIIFGSFCFAMFVFVWFFVPETKGLSLEAMDELFGVVPHDAFALEMEQGLRTESTMREPPQKETPAALVECVEDAATGDQRGSSLPV